MTKAFANIPLNRKGFIKITDQLMREENGLVQLIFTRFFPTHIEFRHWENNIWYYYGISNDFEEIKEGNTVPQYDAQFTTNILDDKSQAYEFNFIKTN